jgi:hypothetical protein
MVKLMYHQLTRPHWFAAALPQLGGGGNEVFMMAWSASVLT